MADERPDVEDVGDLKSEVSRLGTIVTRFHEDINALFNAIDLIRQEVNNSQKTNWGVLIGFASVVLVIVGMVANGYIRDLSELQDDMDGMVEHRVEAARVQGYQEAESRFLHKQIEDHGARLDRVEDILIRLYREEP